MSIILNDNLKINAGKPADSKYLNSSNQPYDSISAVTSGVTISERYSGLTVNIGGDEYWYKNSVADVGLIAKESSIVSEGITGATNGLTKVGQDVILGGTLTGGTEINLDDNIFKIFNEEPLLNVGDGFDDNIYNIEIQSDNKILVGGNFTTYSGVTSNKIIRLDSDGSIDNTFNIGTGFDNYISNIILQLDGKILVGGNFTTYSGVTINRIIRLNTDGSIDETFNIGSGFDGGIINFTIQSDNKILVGGSFTSYSGVTSNRIIRLNTDGSIDETFNIGTGFGGNVRTIKAQLDNKILVGGNFTIYSGVTSNKIIRLDSDGSIDETFNIGSGFDANIYSLTIQSDNKILVGGNFTTYSGVTINRIIRLNTDGSIDETFNIGSGFDIYILNIILQLDGKILVGGNFTTYSGVTSNRIIRLNTDGSIDETFNIGTGFDSGIQNLIIQSDNKILVGGNFTTYDGLTSNRIIRLDTNGSAILSNEFEYNNNTLSLPNLTTSGLTIIDGNESDNYVLTSDNNGNASWDSVYLSAGIYSQPSVTDNGNGTITLGTGEYNLYSDSDFNTPLKKYTLTGGTYSFSDNTTNYLIVDYSGGTPMIYSSISRANINQSSVHPIVTVYRDGNSLQILDWDEMGKGLANKMSDRLVRTERFKPEIGGLAIGELATRYVTLTAGVVWYGAANYSLDAVNSSTDSMDLWYHSGGTWTKTGTTQYNNTQYDNGTDLVDLFTGTTGNTGVNWVFRSVESDKHLMIVLGNESYTLADAQASTIPIVPDVVSSHAILVGRIIVERNATGSTEIASSFDVSFISTPVTEHNTLSNLQGGAANQYFHLDSDSYDHVQSIFTGATNGLTKTGYDIKLGGTLTEDTTISSGSYDLTIDVADFNLTFDNGLITDNNGTPVGLKYNADYSTNYTDRSLVDKSYVDVTSSGLDPKSAVLVTTTTNITLSGETTIDGIGVVAGDRVLVKDQTSGATNGIYVVVSGSSWTRASDFDGSPSNEVTKGALIPVLSGNTNSNTAWILTTSDPIVIDTTELTFSIFSRLQDITGGDGIDVQTAAGGVKTVAVDLATNSALSFSTNKLTVDSSIAGSGLTWSNGIISSDVSTIAITGATNGLTKVGQDVILGGTLTGGTQINLDNNIFKIFNEEILFNIGTGLDNRPYTIDLQSDNKIIAAGLFTLYNGISRNNIVRLNIDGTIDNTFIIGSGFNTRVNIVSTQSNDKILVGGQFTSYSGITKNYIVRLNSDGSIDETFNIGTGFDNFVNFIKIQSDNKILIGGNFTTYSGVTTNRIIRLNTDGSIDNTFNIGTGFDNSIISIDIQSDNKILIGGNFTTYSGVTTNRIIRLNTDGSIDETFNIGTGFNNTIYSIKTQDDNKILVGGSFTTYSGATNNRIIRLNTNGSIDNTFNIGTGFDSSIISIDIQSDNKILIGGNFTTYSGVTSNRIIRLNTDGSIDNTFNIGTGFDSQVATIKSQLDGKILLGGFFTTYNGVTTNRIIRLNTDGIAENIPTEHEFEYNNNTLSLPNLITSGLTIIDGTESDGYILTSDSSGNTSWQSIETGDHNNLYDITLVTGTTYTGITSDYTILVSGASSVTITLPVTPVDKQAYKIKDASGTALTNNITIAGNGNNIDGDTSAIINTDYGALEIVYSVTLDEWYTLSFIN